MKTYLNRLDEWLQAQEDAAPEAQYAIADALSGSTELRRLIQLVQEDAATGKLSSLGFLFAIGVMAGKELGLPPVEQSQPTLN